MEESIITRYLDLIKKVFSGEEAIPAVAAEQTVSLETEKIKSFLPRMFYSMEEEDRQRAFIRNFQSRVIWLSDCLYGNCLNGKSGQPGKCGEMPSVRQFVLSTLDQLLDYILIYFRPYCNEDQKITEYSRTAVTGDILGKLEAEGLPSSHPDHLLFEKVLAAVQQRLREPIITYRLVSYLEILTAAVGYVNENAREQSLPVTLSDILIACNFNDHLILYSLVSAIREETDRQYPDSAKAEHLGRWQKRVNQEPDNPSLAFHLRNERASDFLSKWLRAEILFLEGRSRFSPAVPAPSDLPGFLRNDRKLELNLSVAQIACLMRIFTECGIIQNGSPSELSAFMASHFRSKKQKHISPESLRVKYYNIEESTREEVCRLIRRFLQKAGSPI